MRSFAYPSLSKTVCLLACALLTSLPPLAWAEIDTAILEKADALLKAGKAEEAYQMLEPLEVQGAGDSLYDDLLATAALESNRPSKATFVYERILAVSPDYLGVRADMGRAYLALKDYGRAKIEFETVLTSKDIPNDLRGTVEKYAEIAEAQAKNQRTVATGYVALGLGHDSNINTANNADTLDLPVGSSYAPDKKKDGYTSLGLGGELSHTISDQWGLYAGADYLGRAYNKYCQDTCYWSLDARGGVNYNAGAWSLSTGLTASTFSLNQATYNDSVGLTINWRMAASTSSQFSLGAATTRTSYLTDPTQNTQTNSLTGGWLGTFGDGTWVVSLSGSSGVDLATNQRDEGNRIFYGPRAYMQKTFSDTWSAYISAGLTYSRYTGINAYYLTERNETLSDMALGLTWSVAKGVSLRPQLLFLRNASNAELYSYDKVDSSINARMDF